jgi:hypothetical protein
MKTPFLAFFLGATQIDAHSNFVPFGELFPFRGFARPTLFPWKS